MDMQRRRRSGVIEEGWRKPACKAEILNQIAAPEGPSHDESTSRFIFPLPPKILFYK